MNHIYIDASVSSFHQTVGSAVCIISEIDSDPTNWIKERHFYLSLNSNKFDFLDRIEFNTLLKCAQQVSNTIFFLDRNLSYVKEYFTDIDIFSLCLERNNLLIGIPKIKTQKPINDLDFELIQTEKNFKTYTTFPKFCRNKTRPLTWDVQHPGLDIDKMLRYLDMNYPRNLAAAHILASLTSSELSNIYKFSKMRTSSKLDDHSLKYLFYPKSKGKF